MNNSTFESELAEKGRLVYHNRGTSMRPLIRQGKDLMVIEKPKGRLKRYDGALYINKNGDYILHRVLRVKEDSYVICGDNCVEREYGITDKDVIGVLTGVVRNGKELKATDLRYRIYVHLWCDLIFIRIPLTRCWRFFRRCGGKVKRLLLGSKKSK